jgi:GAF domain-containing protein
VRISRLVATTLDLDELLQHIVEIICSELDFYYAGIFLLDETDQWAVLRAGRGEPGRAMVAEGHKLAVGGNSMVGMAISRGELRISPDVGGEAIFFKNPHLPYTHSEIALPLAIGDEVIGAISVQSIEENVFTPEEVSTLQIIADQVALAIHNLRLQRRVRELLRQTERRARLLRAANQVSRQATHSLDLAVLLPRVVDIICECYGFYYAGVFLVDAGREWAVLHAGHGDPGAAMLAEGHRLKIGGNSMIGMSISLGEARIAMDVGEERIHFKNPHLPHTRSEMALPMRIAGQVLGAVTIQSVEERAFSQDDITTLQTLADHLALVAYTCRQASIQQDTLQSLDIARRYQALADSSVQLVHWMGSQAGQLGAAGDDLLAELSQPGAASGQIASRLEQLIRAARRIDQARQAFLGESREFVLRPVMLVDVVQSAATLSGLPPAFTIEIENTCGNRLALADTLHLTQVCRILLQNAVETGARRVMVSLKPGPVPTSLSIRLADDGPGISPENRARIWEPFYTQKDPAHLGLGLPYCRQALTRMNGQIQLAQREGFGAAFEITLPQAPEAAQASLENAPQSILLVDDDDEWANAIASLLADAGKTVRRRASANLDPAVDLILIDEGLRGAPLAEVLASMTALGVGARTIIVSTAPAEHNLSAYQAAGVRRAALKPYTPAELAILLAEA